MKTGVSVLFLLFVSVSVQSQVLVDTLRFPVSAMNYWLRVPAENEICVRPDDRDTLCHSTDGGATWTISPIPRSWQQRPPLYSLSALPGGVALLAYAETNAARDSQWVGLHRTTDAGRSWISDRFLANERLPGLMDRILLADTARLFLTTGDAWYRSEDAGASWLSVPELDGMRELQFAGNGVGWALDPGSPWTRTAHTTDHGGSWVLDSLESIVSSVYTYVVQNDGSVVFFRSDSDGQQYFQMDIPGRGRLAVFPPKGDGIDEYDLTWVNAVLLNDGRIVASALDNADRGYLFLSADEGRTWARVHLQSDAEGEWTVYSTAQALRHWKLADDAVIMQHRDASEVFSVLRLPDPIPALLHAENYSTMHRLQTLLRWSDPFAGRTASVEVERSASDSTWIPVRAGVAEMQMCLDSSGVTGEEIRYRVTLQSTEGESARVYSSAITPSLGAYVDLPSYIFPNKDRLLEYDVREVRGSIGRSSDTVDTRQTLRFSDHMFLPPSWQIHQVSRIIDTADAGSDTLSLDMIEILIPEHHFSDEGVYFGLGFVLDFGERLLSYGPAHPGMLPAELFDGQAGLYDSVRFQTFYGYTQGWNVTFVARWGIGITSIHGDMSGHGGTFATIDWQLVRHVNEAQDAPTPVSAYTLVSYPNPLTDGATVRYDLPAAGAVTLTVHDMLGRRVAVLAEGHRGAGSHHAFFRPAGLPPGTYLLRLLAGGEQTTRLISVLR